MARNILVKLTGDGEEAKATLDEVRDEIEEFGKTEATAEIRVDGEQAKAEADEMLVRLRALPKEESILIRITADTAALDKLEARMAALKAQSYAAGEAGQDQGAMSTRMGAVQNSIERTTQSLADLDRQYDELGTSAERAMSPMDAAVSQLGAEGEKALTPYQRAIQQTTGEVGKLRDADEDFENSVRDLGAEASRSLTPYETAMRSLEGDARDVDHSIGTLAGDAVRGFGRALTSTTSWAHGLSGARNGLVSLVASVLEKVPLIGGVFASLAKGVGSLATTLIPDAAEGFGAMAAQAVSLVVVGPILLAIVAGVAALIVSLAEAVLGIVALGVAFLAALGPIALVLGLVAVKIKDIVSAQSTLKSASLGVKSALESQKSALLTLHQAETAEATQRIAALAAEKSATLALTDAQNSYKDALLAVKSAQLDEQQARLTLASMQQQLAGFGTSPGDLAAKASGVDVGGQMGQQQTGADPLGYEQLLLTYKEDVLAIKVAAQGVQDADGQAADAAQTLAEAHALVDQYLKEGLKAYGPYLTATNQLATAWDNYARSLTATKAAQLAQSQALVHGQSEAVTFMAVWDKLKKSVSGLFGPAEAAVFTGIEKAMGILTGHAGGLKGEFTKVGVAIGKAFVWWAKMMDKPKNVALIKTLIGDSAKLVGVMSGWLGSALKTILIVATSALPALLKIVGHWASELAGVNATHGKIHNFIIKCVDQATIWWHRIQDIATALIAVAGWLKTMEPLAKAIAAPFKMVETTLNQLTAINKANQQSQSLDTSNKRNIAAQIAKDDKLLKSPTITAQFRRFLLTSIKNLKGEAPEIKATMPGTASNQLVNTLARLFGHASGGVTSGASLGMIGEGGAEALIPLAGGGADIVARALTRTLVPELGEYLRRTLPSAAQAGGVSPAAANVTQHVNLQLNQGDTIASDEHFMTVLDKRLAALGLGLGRT